MHAHAQNLWIVEKASTSYQFHEEWKKNNLNLNLTIH